MKNVFSLIFACALLFSCSKDDQRSDGLVPPGRLQFEITALSTSADGKTTKAPVYSQESTNRVTRLMIHSFIQNGTDYLFSKTYTLPTINEGTDSYLYLVNEAEELEAGHYKFLVIGQEAADSYSLTAASTTQFDDMLASVTAAANVSEIFSGTAEADVYAEGGRVSINISRKVGGVLGYFKNVPQVLSGDTVAFLRLSVSNTNQAVNLVDSIGESPAGTSYNLIDITLTGQPVVNGLYTGNTIAGVVKLENSQLGGAYLLPVDGVTMTLGLYNAAGTSLQQWPVSYGGATTFNIVANNFYKLGNKMNTTSTTGDPENPGDDDEAIDLLTDEVITITISPEWTNIVDLEIN